ncbi:MAG: TetR family transcriptional regulator [Clostridiales bacterium]|jgi:AcrR family transcriptional regulator|nr:TetR family transcriptional regulator [Clostridiales bacterium]
MIGGCELPKIYSDKEREYIIKRLKEEAEECLKLFGVKKTTVDELVRRANIPKGTFYLFYASKELLLFDVINDLHDRIQSKFMHEAISLQEGITSEKLTNLLFMIFKEVDNTCLLSIMTNGDLELLMRKLPDDVVKEHLEHDDLSMEQIMAFIPQARGKNIEHFSGAFRGIFLVLLHKREIGEEIFDDVFKLMINGLVIQLMEE